jgi:hypothetical protein
MKRTKFALSEDIDAMRFLKEAEFEKLRSVLGSTVCYGIRASRAKLSNKCPLRVPPGCALNCAVEQDKESEDDDAPKFVRVPPASQGGFDLIHNGNNMLHLQVRHRKFHFETEDGTSVPLEDCSLPSTLPRDLEAAELMGSLEANETANETVSIRKHVLFDHEQQLWVVTAVFEDHVEAKKAFPEGGQASFF